MKSEAFIIDAVRTPIGKLGGALSGIRTDDLAALTIAELLKKNPSVDPLKIDEVFFGCANQAGEDNRNVARMALLLAGIPASVPGQTINRLCASGMDAVVNASRAIKLGDGDLYIAGGVENMTRAPLVISKADKPFSGKQEIYDSSLGWRFVNSKMKEMFGTESMGETAENIAGIYKINREEQDRFAYKSQMKAARAQKDGRFIKEIIPVEIDSKSGKKFFEDEFVKPNTTLEVLASLKPAFKKNETVTAGNSSGLNDGSCALLLASEDAAKKYNLKPRAKIVTSVSVGVEPRIMGIGPVDAVKKILSKTGMKLDDFDIIELNEAFAAQSLAVLYELGINSDDERLNPNGGAIALGHPLGMSGARLIQTAMIELEEKQKRFALCTLCVGVGQGVAVIIERVG
ncbi:MAG: 3-oxoadipyl-CoA thiolase [Ignavibacteriales bacterium]|nr:3-oxoadipyl-CoA thiolase [Ignavibacteriales bacterium]